MKKTLYPKTIRVSDKKTIVTEKLDGSNLGLFMFNGEIIIAQRNNIYNINELTIENSYKGLFTWIQENKNKLDFNEGSGVFGERIGMGQIKYGESLNKRFYIFAKANIDFEELNGFFIKNLNYDRNLFIYPFKSKTIPDCMGIVPKVSVGTNPSIEDLNIMYDKYCMNVNRKVEGFVINNGNQVKKYIRYKNGKETKHKS